MKIKSERESEGGRERESKRVTGWQETRALRKQKQKQITVSATDGQIKERLLIIRHRDCRSLNKILFFIINIS